MSGMNHTTAVEVNPDIVNIVRDYSDYNGGIYSKYSNIHVYVDEGSLYARRNRLKTLKEIESDIIFSKKLKSCFFKFLS